MRKPSASLSHKMVALLAAFSLAFSMVPAAWADDAPAGTLAGSVAGGAAAEGEAGNAGSSAEGSEGAAGPEAAGDAAGTQASGSEASAELQSADAKAADAAGSATGTTIKIAVYRSSYPLVWDTGDAGAPDATKVAWSKPDAWPKEGSPGSAVGTYAGYSESDEPTRPGFEFLGWSAVKDDPTVAGKLSSLSIPKGTEPVAGDDGVKRITIHALWAPIEYSVVFDLTKNPEDASAVPSFSWTTGKGTFSDLGGGRYRLSGVTLQDYDPERGLIEISTPSRGTGGYRFLSWAEPDSQQSPTVAMQPSGTSKWYVNPVALPYYDYEPVLTARWSLSFDVDVPSQITFDQYDSLEVEGNLTDTTDKDAIDEESPDLHDKGKLAHFCSQSTAVDYKIVALKSEMQPTAKDILTTSDSSKATQEQVLESEKLLSLFAANATSESAGVHFKLTDAVDMDDSSRFGAFVIPKQTKEYSDADFSRDDEERLYVSYRLNLDNAVDGATEPNHGLVTPGNVNEGDRTPIAKVSYEFAVADDAVQTTVSSFHLTHCSATGSTSDSFYIEHGSKVYGPSDIKAAADCISKLGDQSPCYKLYHSMLLTGMDPSDADDPHCLIKWGDGITYSARIIGLSYDELSDGETKAGLTFQFIGLLNKLYPMNEPTCGGLHYNGTSNGSYDTTSSHNSCAGGWGSSLLRRQMNPGTNGSADGTIWKQVPSQLKDIIVPVKKKYYPNVSYAPTTPQVSDDWLFLASYAETVSRSYHGESWQPLINESNNGVPYEWWGEVVGNAPNASTVKYQTLSNGSLASTSWYYWERSIPPNNPTNFVSVNKDGRPSYSHMTSALLGVCPAFCL